MGAQLYPIGAVAKLTGVPIKTIRYYADIGLLPPAVVTDARYRMYGAAEIWRLELVRTLRAFGFGLDEVRGLLRGDVSVDQAIAMQLAAVNEQLAHLTRVQQVLERAQAADSADTSLQHLHELGTALNDDAAGRRQLLIAKMRAMLPDATEPSPVAEQFLATVARQLPESMTPEQSAVWAEIVALVNDPALIEATNRQLALFSGRRGRPNGDGAGHGVPQVLERARAAFDAGASPMAPEVQALVDEWVAVFAAMLERPAGAELEAWLIEHAAELTPEPIERFWTLMARLNGWEQRPSYAPAQRLLVDGLRARRVLEALS